MHAPSKCAGRPCALHNPSAHPMRDWPRRIRETSLIERVCPCGVGHPDPDSVAYLEALKIPGREATWGVHGCCGCCISPVGSPWAVTAGSEPPTVLTVVSPVTDQ